MPFLTLSLLIKHGDIVMRPRPLKVYLMAVPCSGKSFFASNHETYRNLRIIDFCKVASREANMARQATFPKKRGQALISICRYGALNARTIVASLVKGSQRNLCLGRTYQEEVIAYLKAQTISVCALGRPGAYTPDHFSDVLVAAVLPSIEQHKQNTLARKAQRPNDRWHDIERIERIRHKLLSFSEKHNLAVYESFESALDTLIIRFSQDKRNLETEQSY